MDSYPFVLSLLPIFKTTNMINGVVMLLNKRFSIFLLSLMLLGCNSGEEIETVVDPQTFESGEECHVCGMVISRFPGPKGQAFEPRTEQMRKFCSTMELMIWYLQPENQTNVSVVYVHDMAFSPWDKPSDSYLIDAKNAIYVLGSDMPASMGQSLATFSSESAAKSFIVQHGGEIISFENLSLNRLMNRFMNKIN